MGRLLKSWIVVILVVFAILKVSSWDAKHDVCGDIKPSVTAKDTFKFSNHFKVHVEATMKEPDEEDRIAHVNMYFSSYAKKIKTDMVISPVWETHRIHDYENHEILTYSIFMNKRVCQVDTQMRERNSFFLLPTNVPKGQVPKVSDIFRLTGDSGFGDDIALERSDDTVFRNIPCKKYVSCQKFIDSDDNEIVVKITHLLTDTHLTKGKVGTVPLHISLKGKYISGEKEGAETSGVYNFFHYQDYFPYENVELPLGVVCEGRKKVDFPKVPPHMSFGQEIHYPDKNKQIETMETTYSSDEHLKYVEEMYFNQDGTVAAERLDDFHTGLSYFVKHENSIHTCEVKKISKTFKSNDFVVEEDGKIRMVTPQEFFHAGGIEFHYNGQKNLGMNVNTEVWNGKDRESGQIYAWFFLLNVKHSINDYAALNEDGKYKIPYKRMIWDSEETDSEPTSTYFYKMDFTVPSKKTQLFWCFEGNSKSIYLHLPGLKKEHLKTGLKIVERRMVKTIADALQVSWTRIDGLTIHFVGDMGVVSFYLYGRPKIEGDQVEGETTEKEPTLEEAFATLKHKLEDGSIEFDIGGGDLVVKSSGKVIDSPYTNFYRSRTDGGQGYSSGALAGLAISMLIIGSAAGGAGGFWFFLRGSSA